jgi:hypothetical protein
MKSEHSAKRKAFHMMINRITRTFPNFEFRVLSFLSCLRDNSFLLHWRSTQSLALSVRDGG